MMDTFTEGMIVALEQLAVEHGIETVAAALDKLEPANPLEDAFVNMLKSTVEEHGEEGIKAVRLWISNIIQGTPERALAIDKVSLREASEMLAAYQLAEREDQAKLAKTVAMVTHHLKPVIDQLVAVLLTLATA